jgi:hypothetical protein
MKSMFLLILLCILAAFWVTFCMLHKIAETGPPLPPAQTPAADIPDGPSPVSAPNTAYLAWPLWKVTLPPEGDNSWQRRKQSPSRRVL